MTLSTDMAMNNSAKPADKPIRPLAPPAVQIALPILGSGHTPQTRVINDPLSPTC